MQFNSLTERRRFFIAIAFVSMVFGVYWGKIHERGIVNSGNPIILKVLAEPDFLPPQVRGEIEVRLGIRLSVSTLKPGETFEGRLSNGAEYDVAFVRTTSLRTLIQMGVLRSWEKESLSNFTNVSTDFQVTPFDPGGEYALPLFWNVDNATLWVQVLVIPATTSRQSLVYELADYLLDRDVALHLTQLLKRPGVNRWLEEERIPPTLKPSYLRQYSLSTIKLEDGATRAPALFR